MNMHIRVYKGICLPANYVQKICIYKVVMKENCKIFIVTNLIFTFQRDRCFISTGNNVAVSTLNLSENLDVCMFALGSLAPAHYIFMSHAV